MKYRSRARLTARFFVMTGLIMLAGCVSQPQPYSSVLSSRLPANEAGGPGGTGPVLSPAEQKRYTELNREILREQDRARAAENAARAYYAYPYAYPYAPPVTFYGGYSSGGWRHGGWGTGAYIGPGYIW